MPHRPPGESRASWLSPAHLLLALRSLWGALLLTRPRRVGDALGLEFADTKRGRGVVRVLGGRHLVQAGVTAARPTGPVVAVGAAVDALHALTALGWGMLDRSHRRAGLTDAGLAASFGVAGAMVARRTLSPDATDGTRTEPPRTRTPQAATPTTAAPSPSPSRLT